MEKKKFNELKIGAIFKFVDGPDGFFKKTSQSGYTHPITEKAYLLEYDETDSFVFLRQNKEAAGHSLPEVVKPGRDLNKDYRQIITCPCCGCEFVYTSVHIKSFRNEKYVYCPNKTCKAGINTEQKKQTFWSRR